MRAKKHPKTKFIRIQNNIGFFFSFNKIMHAMNLLNYCGKMARVENVNESSGSNFVSNLKYKN